MVTIYSLLKDVGILWQFLGSKFVYLFQILYVLAQLLPFRAHEQGEMEIMGLGFRCQVSVVENLHPSTPSVLHCDKFLHQANGGRAQLRVVGLNRQFECLSHGLNVGWVVDFIHFVLDELGHLSIAKLHRRVKGWQSRKHLVEDNES